MFTQASAARVAASRKAALAGLGAQERPQRRVEVARPGGAAGGSGSPRSPVRLWRLGRSRGRRTAGAHAGVRQPRARRARSRRPAASVPSGRLHAQASAFARGNAEEI